MLFPDVAIGRYPRLRVVVHTAPASRGVIGENPAFDVTHFDRSDGGVTLVTADMLAALA